MRIITCDAICHEGNLCYCNAKRCVSPLTACFNNTNENCVQCFSFMPYGDEEKIISFKKFDFPSIVIKLIDVFLKCFCF